MDRFAGYHRSLRPGVTVRPDCTGKEGRPDGGRFCFAEIGGSAGERIATTTSKAFMPHSEKSMHNYGLPGLDLRQ